MAVLDSSRPESKPSPRDDWASNTQEPFRLIGISCDLFCPQRYEAIFINSVQPTLPAPALLEAQKKLGNYIKTAIQVPDTKQWVNLSPFEPHRILPPELDGTDLGLALIEADLRLKRRLASILDPKINTFARDFWNRFRLRIAKFGDTVPVSTFLKVWTCPDIAQIYEHIAADPQDEFSLKFNIPLGNIAFFNAELKLQIMCALDRLALQDYLNSEEFCKSQVNPAILQEINGEFTSLFREKIVPILNEEVKDSPDFQGLRDCFDAIALASCFTEKFRRHPMIKDFIDSGRPEKLTTFRLKVERERESQLHSSQQADREMEKGLGESSRNSPDSPVAIDTPPSNNPNPNRDRIALTEGGEIDFKQIYYKEYLDLYQNGCSQSFHQQFDPAKQQVIAQTYFSGGLCCNFATLANLAIANSERY